MINIKDKAYIKAFGKHLREIRLEKGKSQEDLAFDADISANQVGRIERGEINPTLSSIYVIAKALKIQPKELLDFKTK